MCKSFGLGMPPLAVVTLLSALLSSFQPAAADDSAPKLAKNAEARQWTDATGKFNVRARLIKLEGGAVHLEKSDGSASVVPLAKLSEKDQEFVHRFFAAQDKRDEAIARGPWQLLSHNLSNLARNSNGTFSITVGSSYLTVVVDYPAGPGKAAASKFRLRNGASGEYTGRLNNSNAKGTVLTMLFEGVAGKEEDLFLCDDKGNQRPLVPRPEGVAEIKAPPPKAPAAAGKPTTPTMDEPKEKTAADVAAQLLQEMDTDRDGSVSFTEFAANRKKEFALADGDADGFLSIFEMDKYIAGLIKTKFGVDLPLPMGAGAAALAPLDTNKDDKISAAEFLNVGRDSFEKLDLNRDGKFDKSELQKGVLEMADLVK